MDNDLKSASASLNEPSTSAAYHPSAPVAPRRSPKGLLIALVAIIVLAGIGFGVWKFVLNKPKKATAPNPAVTQATTQTSGSDVPNVASTESYSSSALSVGFKYPKGWKVTEATGGIRIDSPAFSYPAANLGTVDGLFRVYIRQGARKVDGAYIGAGIAIKSSEKLTYAQPAIGQRADTLLSSFGSNSIDIFTFFLIAGNFQLNKGDTLGPNYGTEPDTYIVAGGYTTPQAVDDFAMNSVAITYYANTNAYKQAVAILASLQLK